MSGLVVGADLCAAYSPMVYGGRIDADTYIAAGAWRGTEWPCAGVKEVGSGEWVMLIECTCPCHAGGEPHELPARANRTAVHPTDVLADLDERKFWGGGG